MFLASQFQQAPWTVKQFKHAEGDGEWLRVDRKGLLCPLVLEGHEWRGF